MSQDYGSSDLLTRKLAARSPLDPNAVAEIRALPCVIRHYDPSGYLIREGEVPQRCQTIIEGYAYRQKLTEDGARQIVALLVPGDIIDLQNLYLHESDHSVQAITRLTTAEVSISSLRDLSVRIPAIATAMWVDALVEASIAREWVLNLGRRDARARLAHLLCEFGLRVQAAGIADASGYEMPLTQEQLADALGLTPVHVNRVLKGLQRDGLIERRRRQIHVNDWNALRAAAGFSQRYLHLRQQTPVDGAAKSAKEPAQPSGLRLADM